MFDSHEFAERVSFCYLFEDLWAMCLIELCGFGVGEFLYVAFVLILFW